MRCKPALLFVSCLSLIAHPVRGCGLAEIARRIPGRTRRASSGLFDPESNRDAYHVGPGRTLVLGRLQGPGEIRHMWFTIAGKDRRYPRTLVLRIYWDGAEVPSVETPIGDFFAAGNGMRANVNSLPVQVSSYGRALNCYWRMPFRKSARIEVTNEGRHRLTVYWQCDWIQFDKPPSDMYYFHARYRQEFPAKPFSPYVVFEGKGQGHYVGTVFSIQCSYGSWFGESDDRFYIDGEAEPSVVGTGCEDYFNDAWNLRLFSHAYTGVTIKEPNGEDCRFTAYRWHIPAPVIFKKSLRVEIERRSYCLVRDPKTGRAFHYEFKYRPDFCSSVAFWYQKTIAEPFAEFPPVEKRLNHEIVVEPVDLLSEIRTSPGVTVRRRSNRVCNLKRALYVENQGPGGWFEIPCTVDIPGTYSISVFQCLYRTGGIWRVTLRPSGTEPGDKGEILLDRQMDFFDPYLAWKENRPENFLYGTWFEKKVGLHKLKSGPYIFRFECVGANPLAGVGTTSGARYNLRLDAISLRKFPWDDLYGMMQEYLAREKALFEARIQEARRTVAFLSRAVEIFHLDTGVYPASLEDLLEKPAWFRGKGRWPYVREIPRDPWRQKYQYLSPGRFNPDSFDLWSFHGNSRYPEGWIGNWPSPFRLKGALEAESLSVARASRGVRAIRQRIGVESGAPLSQGALLFVKLYKEGDWFEIDFPAEAGKKKLTIRFVTSWDYGRFRVELNGKVLQEAIDLYSPGIGTKTVVYENAPLIERANRLRLTAVGRNADSEGFFAGIDAIVPGPQ